MVYTVQPASYPALAIDFLIQPTIKMSGLRRVYIGKLAPDVRQDDIEKARPPLFHPINLPFTSALLQLFRDFKIRECRLMAGFGFVEFEDARDAEEAVSKFDGAKLLGEPIMVEFAKERRPREGMDPRGPPGGFGGPPGGGFGGPPRRGPGVKVLLKGIGSDVSWQVRRIPNFRASTETDCFLPRTGPQGLWSRGRSTPSIRRRPNDW
jgi:hypothetical protein